MKRLYKGEWREGDNGIESLLCADTWLTHYVCCLIRLSQQPGWGGPGVAPILSKRKQSTETLSDLLRATQLTRRRRRSVWVSDNLLTLPQHSFLYWGCGYGKGFLSAGRASRPRRGQVCGEEPLAHESGVWPEQLPPPTWDGQKPGDASGR